jgi:hypothetical protein
MALSGNTTKLKLITMKDKTKVAGIVLAGIAAGAAIYYLMSTENGKATRNKLAGSIKDVGQSLKDLRSRAMDTIDQITGHAADTYDTYSDKAKKFKSNAKTAVTNNA